MRPSSQWFRHHHKLEVEKVTIGRLSGETIYHFRCVDEDCRWSFWCYKHEFWST